MPETAIVTTQASALEGCQELYVPIYECGICSNSFGSQQSIHEHYEVKHPGKDSYTIMTVKKQIVRLKQETFAALEDHKLLSIPKIRDTIEFGDGSVQSADKEESMEVSEKPLTPSLKENVIVPHQNTILASVNKFDMHDLNHNINGSQSYSITPFTKMKTSPITNQPLSRLASTESQTDQNKYLCTSRYGNGFLALLNEDSCSSISETGETSITQTNTKTEAEIVNAFNCEKCGQSFSTLAFQQAHMLQHSTGSREYTCTDCSQKFVNCVKFRQHCADEHRNTQPFKCEICGSQYSNKQTLRVHYRSHSGERPYTCEECGMSFRQSSTYRTHLRRHSSETPFKCNVCSKSFSVKTDLWTHTRIHQVEAGCTCQVCGATFPRNTNLIRHMRTHTGEKPYQCDICEKAFSRSGNRDSHRMKHFSERPYKCVDCGKTFNDQGNFCKHKRLHKRKEDLQNNDETQLNSQNSSSRNGEQTAKSYVLTVARPREHVAESNTPTAISTNSIEMHADNAAINSQSIESVSDTLSSQLTTANVQSSEIMSLDARLVDLTQLIQLGKFSQIMIQNNNAVSVKSLEALDKNFLNDVNSTITNLTVLDEPTYVSLIDPQQSIINETNAMLRSTAGITSLPGIQPAGKGEETSGDQSCLDTNRFINDEYLNPSKIEPTLEVAT